MKSDDYMINEGVSPPSEPTSTIDSKEYSNHGFDAEPYKTYKIRWYVLATLMALNFSNAMAWICFAAITNFTAEYYNVSTDAVNWLSLIYLVVTVPFGFVASWVLDTFGIRTGMLVGSWANLIGIAIRYISTIPTISDDSRFAVVMVGQGIAAFAQPFLLFAPTKLAAVWFPEDQRVIANTCGSMSNPLGILVSFVVSSSIVSGPADIPTMLWAYIIPAGVACAMCTLGVCHNTPPTPPTASADVEHEPFFAGLKKCALNIPFVLLFFTFGGGYALFNAFSTFLEQIVCPIGYNDDFAGLVGALMIGCGLLGAVISGLIVDRTKAFTPVTKGCFVFAVLSAVIFVVFANFDNLGVGLAIGAVGFGLFGFALFPVALELGVECTYPVAEGTSAGLLQISGQFQGIILILLGQFLSQPLNIEDAPVQQCVSNETGSYLTPEPGVTPTSAEPVFIQSILVPLYIFAGYAVVLCVLLVAFFKTDYKRIDAERALAVSLQ